MRKDRKKFDGSEDSKSINRHFSATYLLISLAMNHFEQGLEILDQYGLTEHEIKRAASIIEKQFDKLDKEYRKLVTDQGSRLFVEDYESTLNQFDQILGFEEKAL